MSRKLRVPCPEDTPLELWGGLECTVNRVGNAWHDQLERSRHHERHDDLRRIADLGIRTLRYPILWETTVSDDMAARWVRVTEKMRTLRALDIRPVVGLMHHGSGPAHTSLLDPNFAPGLARFAAAVAVRFPWISRYTPVNEPLTTARFSCLYGHWYPHRRDDRSFARAFVNQCRAVVLAMKAIRCINPAAELVQTEDLGTTYGTHHMRYQCDFDNERRWMTWDVLCGRVDERHPMWHFLVASGIAPHELAAFCADPCPPQIIGVNHYVTSDRYLDEQVAAYPAMHQGGNAVEPFVDLEAVRAIERPYRGWRVVGDAWQRYGIAVAITEAQLACTREEQLRWLYGAWDAARAARAAGCEVGAVTAWSLFGAFDWDSLLTQARGTYEPGAFDLRAGVPRATALAGALCRLAAGDTSRHPTAAAHGWWNPPGAGKPAPDAASACILICGGNGVLGRAFLHACHARRLAVHAPLRSALDITSGVDIDQAICDHAPWAIVDATGCGGIDRAEHQDTARQRDTLLGIEVLTDAARRHGIPLLSFSADMVFDGNAACAYLESSGTAPLNAYGRAKVAAERIVLDYDGALCVRTAACFGDSAHKDFLGKALRRLATGDRVPMLADVTVSPTYLPDLVHLCLDLLIDEFTGLLHLVNQGSVTWADLAYEAAARLSIDPRHLAAVRQADLHLSAPRPRNSTLGSERTWIMPTLDAALDRYARETAAAF